MVCAEAARDFLFHFCHAALVFSSIIGEADIGVCDEAQDGSFVRDETLMQVVGVGFCDPPAFPFWRWGRAGSS